MENDSPSLLDLMPKTKEHLHETINPDELFNPRFMGNLLFLYFKQHIPEETVMNILDKVLEQTPQNPVFKEDFKEKTYLTEEAFNKLEQIILEED